MSDTRDLQNDDDMIPLKFYLGQNYPDPFKDTTTIKYCVAHKSRVFITVYDSEGEMVQRLVDGEKEPGTYEAVLHAKDFLEGTYTYEMKAVGYKAVKKMLLLR